MRLLPLLVFAFIVACGSEMRTDAGTHPRAERGDGADEGEGDDAHEGEGDGAHDGEGDGDEGGGEGDGGGEGEACAALADRVSVTSVTTDATVNVGFEGPWSSDSPVLLWPTSTGAAVGWHDGAGTAHATFVDAAFARVGSDVTTAADELRAFVATDDGAAFLVVRGDQMLLVSVALADNQEQWSVPFVGGTDHATEGDRWIDSWPHDGALDYDPVTHQYAAYFGQTGNWGAQGNHQGDRLVIVDDAGQPSLYWDWGCSHSLEMRITHGANGFGPVCLSDCYPTKGILFANRGAVLHDEPSGGCNGYSNAELGGIAPILGGFAVTFVSPLPLPPPAEGTQQEVGFVTVKSDTLQPSAPVFFEEADDQSAAHIARYGANLLVGYRSAGALALRVVDDAGATLDGAVSIDTPVARKDPWVTMQNGDVAWAYASGSDATLHLVRVAGCR